MRFGLHQITLDYISSSSIIWQSKKVARTSLSAWESVLIFDKIHCPRPQQFLSLVATFSLMPLTSNCLMDWKSVPSSSESMNWLLFIFSNWCGISIYLTTSVCGQESHFVYNNNIIIWATGASEPACTVHWIHSI